MKVVIIGGVAGGMSAATRLRRLDANVEIIVIERSGHVSYANCGLPYYVGGVIEDEAALLLQTPESLHARFRLDVRVMSEVLSINAATKMIEVLNLANGEQYSLSYDKLVLSPGASPIVPPLPGIERAHTLRTVEDVERIATAVDGSPRTAVVIGGGFIGLEIAENLTHRGISTAIIEAAHQVMAPLDPEMATLVTEELVRNKVEVHLGVSATEVTASTVVLANGKELPAELVILAIGVRPDTNLAKSAGVAIGARGGIVVDSMNRTSDRDIYAVGDAAEKIDAIDGASTLVPLANLANRHGRVVADHIAGRKVRVATTIGTAIVKVFGLTIAVTGWNQKRLKAAGRSSQAIHTHPNNHAGYYPGAQQMALKLIFDPGNGEILGAQAVGREGVDKRIDVIATAMRGKITASELADLELAYAPPFGSAKDPINMLGYIAENIMSGMSKTAQWDEVEDFRTKGYQILDVRTEGEYRDGHLDSALNIPVDEIRERVSEIPQKKILVHCQVGMRGHTATALLQELGFEATNLDGGYLTYIHSPAAVKN